MNNRDTENFRTLAQMKDRDPVDAAFSAVVCLSDENKRRLEARFNEVFGASKANPLTLNFTGLK